MLKMFDDVSLLQDALQERYKIEPHNIIAFGRSIGSLFVSEYSLRYPNIGT